ncbi:hypothetical protein SO802_015185 [Lithocarpus litseifolius]|uniref:Uncharacterized protein n=1 Tax=Lithocarpus litseifolius TaxID=425828 RepID=A0AAW2CVE1_9ROSI
MQDRSRYQPNLVSAHEKGTLLLEDNNKEKQNPVLEQRPVSILGPMILGGREGGSRCINKEFESGETNTVKIKWRAPFKTHSNRNKHAYGKEHDLRHTDWTGKGLTVEVNEEGIRRVVWNSNKGRLRHSFWVNSNRREHVGGPFNGTRVFQNFVVHKESLRRSKSRAQHLSALGSAQECNSHMGFPSHHFPKPTGPSKMAEDENPFSNAQKS